MRNPIDDQIAALNQTICRQQQALDLLTNAFELMKVERNALREEVDRLALDLRMKEHSS